MARGVITALTGQTEIRGMQMSNREIPKRRMKTPSTLLALAGIVGALALSGCGPTYVRSGGYGSYTGYGPYTTYADYGNVRTYEPPRYRTYEPRAHRYFVDAYGRRHYY